MTDLRTAAQQAIGLIASARLCEVNSMSSRQEMLRLLIEAIDTLRAALAQQAELERLRADNARLAREAHTWWTALAGATAEIEQWRRSAGCVRAEPAQEPVAIADGTFNHDCPIGTLLYTAPPRQKPLTEDEIPALAEKAWKPSIYYDAEALLGTDGLVALARAVEQAHGIKE